MSRPARDDLPQSARVVGDDAVHAVVDELVHRHLAYGRRRGASRSDRNEGRGAMESADVYDGDRISQMHAMLEA